MVRPWCILCHAAEYTCRFGISKWDLTIYNWKSNTVLTKPTIWCCWYSMYSILPMLLVPVVQEPGINISVVPKCCLWLHGTVLLLYCGTVQPALAEVLLWNENTLKWVHWYEVQYEYKYSYSGCNIPNSKCPNSGYFQIHVKRQAILFVQQQHQDAP